MFFLHRTPSKQKSPQEEKDIDIVELLRNVDPKEYEKYARLYGITDYRGLLQAIEQLKREKAEESGRPVNSFNIKLYSIEFNGLVFFSEHNSLIYLILVIQYRMLLLF